MNQSERRLPWMYRRPLMHSNGTARAVPTGSGEPRINGTLAALGAVLHGPAGLMRFLSTFPRIMRAF